MTRSRLVAVALCAAALLGVFARGQVSTSDGLEMYRVSVSVVDDQDVWLDEVPRIGVTGRGGHRTSKYGPLLPIAGVVPVALATPVAKVTGHEDQVRQFAWSLLIPAAAVALLLWMIALGVRLGASFRWSLAVASGALFCTYALPYTEDSFTEPLTALAVVGAMERLLAGRLGAAGALVGLGMLARPQLAPVGALLILAGAWAADGTAVARIRAALPAVWGPLAAGVALAAYNLLRFGDLTQTGYKEPVDPGFTTPILDGLDGLFLTSSKSVLLFAPLVLLVPWGVRAAWRSGGSEVTTAVAVAADDSAESAVGVKQAGVSAESSVGVGQHGDSAESTALRDAGGDGAESASAAGTGRDGARSRRRRTGVVLLVANALLTLVTAATWWSWMGGWSWGPRLLLPGLLPLLVVLGPWLTQATGGQTLRATLTRTWPGRAFAAAAVVGFAVSASTLLVSPQAQLLDRPVPDPGPSATRQYAMVGSRLSALRDPADPVDGGDQKKLVPTWQVALAREAGTPLYLVGAAGTGALLLLGAVGVRRLRAELRGPAGAVQ